MTERVSPLKHFQRAAVFAESGFLFYPTEVHSRVADLKLRGCADTAAAYGLWRRMVHGSGVWFMGGGVWFMAAAYGSWAAAYGLWATAYGLWATVRDSWAA